MPSIYLLRHGKASFGAADYDRLDPLGVQQSECLGRALGGCGLRDPLYVSGAQRRHQATMTACMAAMGTVGEIRIDPRWNEFDHEGILAAAYPTEIEQLRGALAHHPDPQRAFQRLFSSAVERWVGGAHDQDYAEPYAAFRARVTDALEAVAQALGSGRDAVVSTSGGPIACAMQQVLGLADDQVLALNWVIANASYTRLLTGRAMRLTSFNVHLHLEQAGPGLLTYR